MTKEKKKKITHRKKVPKGPKAGDRRMYKGKEQIFSPPAWRNMCNFGDCERVCKKEGRCYRHKKEEKNECSIL